MLVLASFFFIHTATESNESICSYPEDVPLTTHPAVVTTSSHTSIHETLSTDGLPKSSVVVSATALIAGVAAGIIVLGLVSIIILIVALFVQWNKQKVHVTHNHDVSPVFEGK